MATKNRLLIALTVLLLATIAGVWFARSRYTNSTSVVRAQQGQPPEGSLRWYAQGAAASGQTRIALFLSTTPLIANDLNQAISENSLVVAQLITQESVWYETNDGIYTWYKFRLTEALAQKPYVPCTSCTLSPPSGLLPLQSGEFLVPLAGGSAVIDGVAVQTQMTSFNGLVLGQNYLLFMNWDVANGMATTRPQGILWINSDNTFTPVMNLAPGETEPIINGLATQYGNSLTQLRAALVPPPTCNPGQQQACEDDGGTWNASNCSCTPAFDPCMKKPWLCE